LIDDGIYIGNDHDTKLFVFGHVSYDNDITFTKVVDGEIKYAIYITENTGNFASIHASGKGIRRDKLFLNTCFDYVFNVLRIKKLVSVVHSKNKLSMRFTELCGGVPVYKSQSGDDFFTFYELTKSNCKFL